MDNLLPDMFLCEKYKCKLTRQSCIDRQRAKTTHGIHRLPTHPGCQNCIQGLKETEDIMSAMSGVSNAIERLATLKQINQTGGENMAWPNKIDNDVLRKMIADGKFTNEIAKEFNVVSGAVSTRIKKLGLTPNYRRNPNNAQPAAPAHAPDAGQLKSPIARHARIVDNIMPQIIPVTLRLTVEVNVRVNAIGNQGA